MISRLTVCFDLKTFLSKNILKKIIFQENIFCRKIFSCGLMYHIMGIKVYTFIDFFDFSEEKSWYGINNDKDNM